jgi:hypothetical protein
MRNLLAVLVLSVAVPCFMMGGCVGTPFWGNLFWNSNNNDAATTGDDDTTGGNTDDTSGGNPDDTNPTGGDATPDGGGSGELTVVKTGIPLRFDAGLQCGDDLIAFGTETAEHSTVGISYVFPSESPTAGTPVPDSDQYDNRNFDAARRWIYMAGSNWGDIPFQVSVLNVDTQDVTTFDTTDIRLGSLVVAAADPGRLQADGNYCVVICDPSEVTDGKMIKVIDVSSGTPTLVSLDQNPTDSVWQVAQVAVDGTTQKVAVAAEDSLWIYDLTHPTAAPQNIVPPNGVGDYQMEMYGDYIIAPSYDESGYDVAILIDLAANSVITLNEAEMSYALAIGGDLFAFFSYHDSDDSVGGAHRAAVGTLPGPSFNKPSMDNYVDGSYTSNGNIGYAQTMCIPPSGDYVFLADWYLQYSEGDTSFTVPADPNGTDTYGCPAWDIDCSENTVGFHSATDRTNGEEGVLGYIILN